MSKTSEIPTGIIAIIIYKTCVFSLLIITSIALFFALKNYKNLYDYADYYLLTGEGEIVKSLLEKLLHLSPQTLQLAGIATAVYGIVNFIEAIGLWYKKKWAKYLVVGIVGISIPWELYELIAELSMIKLVITTINIAVFLYVLNQKFD